MGAAESKLTEREDEWQRKATAVAIAAARKVVLGNCAPINQNTPIGRLGDVEWGWIITSAIFAWIAAKAEQATAEGFDVETTIRTAMLDPDPWDTGMVASILPQIADLKGFDWSKPLADWSRDSMIEFLLAALELIRQATVARDLGGGSIIRKNSELPADIIPL